MWKRLASAASEGTTPKESNSNPTAPQKKENVHKLITPSLNHYYKIPHYPPQGGCGFEGIHSLWSPLPAKAIKLPFYFTQNSVSKLQLSVR